MGRESGSEKWLMEVRRIVDSSVVQLLSKLKIDLNKSSMLHLLPGILPFYNLCLLGSFDFIFSQSASNTKWHVTSAVTWTCTCDWMTWLGPHVTFAVDLMWTRPSGLNHSGSETVNCRGIVDLVNTFSALSGPTHQCDATSVAKCFRRDNRMLHGILLEPRWDFSCFLIWNKFLKMNVSGSTSISSKRFFFRGNWHQQDVFVGRERLEW